MVSYSKVPSVIDFTSVVLPAFCRPTMAISSSLLKNLDLIQERILSTKENIGLGLSNKKFIIMNDRSQSNS